ncbi:MAG TPA: hypothetical protein VMS08_03430 [Candidatus Saccharimonadia bacterium]|nr:hypothetical protein [Candidatus Saccharimonadia bacterium]
MWLIILLSIIAAIGIGIYFVTSPNTAEIGFWVFTAACLGLLITLTVMKLNGGKL